jgi:hypothetical protein
MTALPALAVHLDYGTCAYGTAGVWSELLTSAAVHKHLKSGHCVETNPAARGQTGPVPPILGLIPHLNEILHLPPSAFFGFSLCGK